MAFPTELKKMRRWVCYCLCTDKDGGKPRKIPINPETGKAAKSNDPATWSDYETAFIAVLEHEYAGLGFMFADEDGLVGVDIDHCYDPKTDNFNDIARKIIERSNTYAE